jgi:tetratricopeptide (TPR) repeat protein
LEHADDGSAAMQRDMGMGYYNLAQYYLAAGNSAAAEAQLAAAIDVFERLAEKSPGDLNNRRRLAICRRMLGDAQAASGEGDAAIESYETASKSLHELAVQNPNVAAYAADLAGIQMNLALQLDRSGDAKGALVKIESAISTLRKLTARKAAIPRQRCDLGVALRFAGELLARQQRSEEARERLAESREVLQTLVREHPGDAAFAAELKITADALAELDAI